MSDKETSGEPVTSADILFECGSCGKSLVIDANGAGLAVTCPDCGAELQVPASEGGAGAAPSEAGFESLPAEGDAAEEDLRDISDVLADANEQVNALKEEVSDLQIRRNFLEKRSLVVAESLQSFKHELLAIQSAIDRMNSILAGMEGRCSGDTQPLA